MKYIFPRQFNLHNVFDSKIDHKDTALRFKDYTLREKEISQQFLVAEASGKSVKALKTSLPPRLRTTASELVEHLRKRHLRCPYVALIRHYCPVDVR